MSVCRQPGVAWFLFLPHWRLADPPVPRTPKWSQPKLVSAPVVGLISPLGCTLDLHWVSWWGWGGPRGWSMCCCWWEDVGVWVGDVLSAFFFFSLLPLCRHWSHPCWVFKRCHSTQLNHLFHNRGCTLCPLVWGLGAWLVYGLFQLKRPEGMFTRLSADMRKEVKGVLQADIHTQRFTEKLYFLLSFFIF